jgi:hypothetical protein
MTKSDCLDGFDCMGQHCVRTSGSGGGTGDGGPGVETNCGNSIDDDHDGQTDCADTDCNLKPCGTGAVCCGTNCTYLTTDMHNCGGCGTVCAATTPPQPCLSATVGGGVLTGDCGCLGAACPGTQQCINEACQCSTAADCAAGEVCDKSAGPGLCHYP